MKHGADAVKAYLMNCVKHGDPLPTSSSASGQWRQRVPRSLHSRLVAKARQEGVSLNTLVTAMIKRMDAAEVAKLRDFAP